MENENKKLGRKATLRTSNNFLLTYIVNFFSSSRVNQYLNRLKGCYISIIIFTLIHSFMWIELDFINVNFGNSMLVFFSNICLFVSNFINLVKICCFARMVDNKIINRVQCIFYVTFFGFIINLIETLFTLFGAYLNYFESK
jgi:hypothetical protein